MSTAPVLIVTATAAVLAACSTTPSGATKSMTGIAMTQTAAGAAGTVGYLPEARLAALAATVPAPSADGSEAQIADRALSDRYRVLERSDRWLLATSHAELSPSIAPQHFDCALGVRFAAAPTPRLTAIFDKLLKDSNGAADLAKAHAFRPRPVGVDPTRLACTTVNVAARASASYPSGSATVGTAYAEAMAELDPAHAAAARETGRQIGLSRVVCAMHYPADVAAAEPLGRAVFAEASATPAFAADLEAARAELAAVRATGLTSPGCAAERAAFATPLP